MTFPSVDVGSSGGETTPQVDGQGRRRGLSAPPSAAGDPISKPYVAPPHSLLDSVVCWPVWPSMVAWGIRGLHGAKQGAAHAGTWTLLWLHSCPVVSPRGMGLGLTAAGPHTQQGPSGGRWVPAPAFPFSQDLAMARSSWLWSLPQEEGAWVPFEFLLVLTETPGGAGEATHARSQPGCDHGGWG